MSLEFDVFFVFDGECRDAVAFYEEVFRIDPDSVNVMTFGEFAGDAVPDQYKDRILSADMSLYGRRIILADSSDFYQPILRKGNNVMMAIAMDNKAEVERIFDALSEEAESVIGLVPTEAIDLLGIVTDKFGITWQISLSPKGEKLHT